MAAIKAWWCEWVHSFWHGAHRCVGVDYEFQDFCHYSRNVKVFTWHCKRCHRNWKTVEE